MKIDPNRENNRITANDLRDFEGHNDLSRIIIVWNQTTFMTIWLAGLIVNCVNGQRIFINLCLLDDDRWLLNETVKKDMHITNKTKINKTLLLNLGLINAFGGRSNHTNFAAFLSTVMWTLCYVQQSVLPSFLSRGAQWGYSNADFWHRLPWQQTKNLGQAWQ